MSNCDLFANANSLGKVQVCITVDQDRAEYLHLIYTSNSSDILCKEEIVSTNDLKPYIPQKCDESWFLTVNQTYDPSKKDKFSLNFASSPASAVFHKIIQDCVDLTKAKVLIFVAVSRT